MPQPLQVVPAAVRLAGVSVDDSASSFSARMTASHNEVEASQAGVPVAAGVALRAAMAQWSADVVTLRDRMVDFGGALQGFAGAVATNDEAAGAAYGAMTGAVVAAP